NDGEFVAKDVINYWQDVDLYVGGAEHAVSHILYSRLIHKFLFDMGKVPTREPYKKLLNQGMIGAPIVSIHLGLLKTAAGTEPVWVGANLAEGTALEAEGLGAGTLVFDDTTSERKVPLRMVEETSVDNEASFRIYKEAIDALEADKEQDAAYFRGILSQAKAIAWATDKDGRKYIELSHQMGKMSKSKHNVINPDDICARYGTDCFRMYEMFLGQIDQAKPWSVSGIDGVYRFLRRYWNLYTADSEALNISDAEPTKEEMKVLHTLIKKVSEDIDKLSFNTCVSAFMVATNDLGKMKCNKRAVLEPMTRLIAPFAPHVADELYHALGGDGSVHLAQFPEVEEKWLVEDSFTYPIAFNGKTRLTLDFPAGASKEDIETGAKANAEVQKQLEGKTIRKVIVVPKRMVNFVVG
ncbi:MAG: leucyl-tRNA synthetase, partial [Bdellovibrionota bacterium]